MMNSNSTDNLPPDMYPLDASPSEVKAAQPSGITLSRQTLLAMGLLTVAALAGGAYAAYAFASAQLAKNALPMTSHPPVAAGPMTPPPPASPMPPPPSVGAASVPVGASAAASTHPFADKSAEWLQENLPKLRDLAMEKPSSENLENFKFAQQMVLEKSEGLLTVASLVANAPPNARIGQDQAPPPPQPDPNADVMNKMDLVLQSVNDLKQEVKTLRAQVRKTEANVQMARAHSPAKSELMALTIAEVTPFAAVMVDRGRKVTVRVGEKLPGGAVFQGFDPVSRQFKTDQGAFLMP
jgi:hypothetical protein